MKKLGLYTMALLSMGLVACNQDFDTEFVPQSNLPESLLQMSDVSVAANSVSTINLSDYIAEDGTTISAIPVGTVSVKEGAMPANTILKAEVEFSKSEDFAESIALDANSLDGISEITVDPTTLQDAYFNDITRNPATTTLYMRTVLYTVTDGTSLAIVGKPGNNFFAEKNVTFTPLNKVQISPAYYVIGAAGGWSADGARTQKFNHSDADVYEDPIFTIVVDAGGDDCWFAIGDDAALDAVADGDWTKLFGTKGASEDLTGTMDFRYNLGGDHSFHVTGAKKIRITLDMLEYTYKIEPVNISDAYYLIGGPGEWNATSAMTMKFSHSDVNVFDDPVFTYVFEGNGGTDNMWFAFGDKDAIDAVAEGTWDRLFGTKGESTDLSGSFDRRYILGGDHSFCVDGKAKFYRFQVNMSTNTYTITPLNFAEYFYEIGNEGGWSTPHALYGGAGDGKYQGYYYLDGEFKFKPNADNWDDDLEYVSGDNMSGTLQSTGGPNCPDPGAGFYQINLDAAGMTYSLTKIDVISIIGDFNGWSDDVDMTYNKEEGCWEATAEVNTNGFKFRMNHDWAISWGGANGDGKLYGNLTQNNGQNLIVDAAGTYKFQLYLSCEGANKVVISKQ